ncbi:DNA-directed RNA polymerase subunit omega [Helicobacter sp. MIT 14-3879]|uniref:DNA-directed RNA polymerase subunit omega n=1 Tax=Helicobacter sp. MIT 14-3879 TaxID=2040649 RepID=UPI000E1EECA8|nr:DNA-directed RNA polymerase subunit omega [Helicobacter sp. MIT 14-3879]RDU61653.1 DNA-directed RNA polymerase subunit omega [Helicobacter sp. MIT 14-3879]
MERIEDILEKALEKVDNDRYKLSCFIFSRVKELSEGATPLVKLDMAKYKFADIAMYEIAEGKISIDRIENID